MKKIGIIGCGNMGEAILKTLISNGIASGRDIFISDVDSAKLDRIKKHYNCDATFNNSRVAELSNVIIIAVKPQDMASVLSSIAGELSKKKLVISIAAGVTIKKISSIIGKDIPIVRVMPNMPALIGRGFSALTFSKRVDKSQARFARDIFGAIGDTVEVKEGQMDAITAISGSGPAYFFYLVELLIKNGVKLGLKREMAKDAAIKTALGSIELLSKIGEDPAVLRKRVTSKGGTTEAAFKVFKRHKLDAIIEKGIRAAKMRSKKLSGG